MVQPECSYIFNKRYVDIVFQNLLRTIEPKKNSYFTDIVTSYALNIVASYDIYQNAVPY